MKLSEFGKDFLFLALRINKHIRGYIDFYIGPQNLRKIVDHESLVAPNTLLNDSNKLLNQLGAQGYNKERESYIKKLLVAMKTSIEKLNGVEIPFKERFLRLYDVDLRPVNESELDSLKEEFNEAYKGTGRLNERMKIIREKRKIPGNKVFSLYKRALDITKLKTKELLGEIIPKNERILIELVESNNNHVAKWSYYNWYLGNCTSRIEVNPNYNMYWSSLLSAAAHEGYPGHHTEFVIKEKWLFREESQFEHSILLLNSPKLIISEGIATLAVNVLFSYRDQAEISLKEFSTNKFKEGLLDSLIKQNCIKWKMNLFLYDFAYHALIDEWSEEKLYQYATNFEIFSKEEINNRIKLLKNAVYSTATFSYFIGSKLIMNKYSEFPSIKNFINLLSRPILPSDLL